jgi:hypothetical protein
MVDTPGIEGTEGTEGTDERGLLVVVAGAAAHRAGLLAEMEGLAVRLAAPPA